MSAHLFVIEDEPALAALIVDYAHAAGFTAAHFSDGAEALAAIRGNEAGQAPDLLILDLMLPGLDGLTLCRSVRQFSELPIIMVTARVEEVDRLIGLESGADDYLCKPFSPRELMARVRVILRRSAARRAEPKSAWQVDAEAQKIFLHGQVLDLTPTEFRLLATLLERPGKVFARGYLLDAALPDGLDVSDRSIDSHIKNLRRKLLRVLPSADPIQSVYGVGYRFDA